MGYVWLRTWWVTSERSKPTGDPLQRATADSDLHDRELIKNQHCLHTFELGNSALLTLRTLNVGWLYKIDSPSLCFFLFCGPLSENKLLWRLSRWSLMWDVTPRSSYLWSRSCLLIEHYFRLPLLKRYNQTLLRIGEECQAEGVVINLWMTRFGETHKSTTETLNRGAMN